jgi:hypothetical protein
MMNRRTASFVVLALCLGLATASSAQGRPARWSAVYGELFYQSPTVVVTGNTGIIATPGVASGGLASFPLHFTATGTNMLTDETNTLTIDWYADASGTGGIICTTTFDVLTAGSLTDLEIWPGDCAAYNAGRDLVPLMPFMKITHTLAGTTKSMEYTLRISYTRLHDI